MLEFLKDGGITVVAWLILMFIGTNLIGVLVRGFVSNPELEEIAAKHEFLAKEHKKGQLMTNVIAVALIILFLSALYYFWNFGVVVAASLLMAARVPDIIWELRHGRQLQAGDMIKPKFHILTTMISWVSLPVLWYGLFRM